MYISYRWSSSVTHNANFSLISLNHMFNRIFLAYKCLITRLFNFLIYIPCIFLIGGAVPLPTMLIFPYFLESHVQQNIPSLQMLDYKVRIYNIIFYIYLMLEL